LSEANNKIFYKQDDKFKQPMVGLRCKIMTNDLNYPDSTDSKVFALMWTFMFNNTMNEFMFQAEDAGIVSEINPRSDHIEILIDGWSDTMDLFVSEYF